MIGLTSWHLAAGQFPILYTIYSSMINLYMFGKNWKSVLTFFSVIFLLL